MAKKKATAKKKTATRAAAKPTTKSETLNFIADKTGLTKKDVGAVFDNLAVLMKRDLKVKDMGTILPGHGGLLDRFDALLLVLPTVYYTVRLLA